VSILLLDAGNSRLKWAFAEGGGFPGGYAEHEGNPAAVVDRIPVAPVAAAWISNVTGEALGAALSAAVQSRFGIAPAFARVQPECRGLRVAYADPVRLGVDRWLAMLALWCEYRKAFVTASAGTALTFDAVDASGQHLGGVIAPGLLTAQRAVLGATRFAAGEPVATYQSGLGIDTDSCVRQGAFHACAGLMERLADRYAVADAPRVLSGGDAAVLIPDLKGGWLHRTDLVMDGLLALAAQSGGK
jgi:type III pantothenate kinase